MRISIEGNIGSGKSTLFQKLKDKHPDWTFVDEPVHQWSKTRPWGSSMLEAFYKSPTELGFPFEIYALCTRVQELKTSQNNAKQPKANVTISERCAETDAHVFAALQNFSEFQKESFQAVYQLCQESEPVFVVYLCASPETCLQRVQTRNRPGEETMTVDYLRSVHNAHEAWISKRSNVLIVPTDESEPDEILEKVDLLLQAWLL